MIKKTLYFHRGIPLKRIRKTILYLFERNKSNNDQEYRVVMNTVFNGSAPETFKNCPLFSEFEKLEDVLNLTFLNERGLYVNLK